MPQKDGQSQWEQLASQQPVYVLEGGKPALFDGLGIDKELEKPADVMAAYGISKPLVVTASFFESYPIGEWLEGTGIAPTFFEDFNANPTYEQVCAGIAAFRANGCDSLISVGGGSAIDIAKCVQAYESLEGDGVDGAFVGHEIPDGLVTHMAVPSTAGTGSESTHFAVMYVQGEKYSLADHSLLPTVALLDPSLLIGLPDYQKKATMLDALCQAIESYWSKRSSEASRAYSAEAIALIMKNAHAYLAGNTQVAAQIMRAANRAGKAINITTTTAPHAFSYKLTSLYGAAHGHAVALCMPHLWQLLIERGDEAVQGYLSEISQLMGGSEDPHSGLGLFDALYRSLSLAFEPNMQPGDLEVLCGSVNQQRLSNFPLELSRADMESVYRRVLSLVRD